MEVTILPKGGTVNIKEKAPSLTKVLVGLGWDVDTSGGEFDLDATAVLLNESGKVVDDKAVVYYGNLAYTANGNKVVEHTGDNLTGEGDGDDESIILDLANMPENVAKIAVLVNIYEASSRSQNFGKVNSSFIRLADANSKEEFAKHDLQKEYASNTGVLAGEFYRQDGVWHFKATAEGVNGSISEILKSKGME
jgi:tellurium resistance protein TerD